MPLRISYFLLLIALFALPAKLVVSYFQYNHTRSLSVQDDAEEQDAEIVKADKKTEYIPVNDHDVAAAYLLLNITSNPVVKNAKLRFPYRSVPTPPPQLVIA